MYQSGGTVLMPNFGANTFIPHNGFYIPTECTLTSEMPGRAFDAGTGYTALTVLNCVDYSTVGIQLDQTGDSYGTSISNVAIQGGFDVLRIKCKAGGTVSTFGMQNVWLGFRAGTRSVLYFGDCHFEHGRFEKPRTSCTTPLRWAHPLGRRTDGRTQLGRVRSLPALRQHDLVG